VCDSGAGAGAGASVGVRGCGFMSACGMLDYLAQAKAAGGVLMLVLCSR